MIEQQTCSNCGGEFKFNEDSQLLTCSSCSHSISIDDTTGFEEMRAVDEVGNLQATADGVLKDFTCKSCGATLSTDAHTSVVDCIYCGSNSVIPERMQGSLQPTLVIPFEINKRKARELFTEWANKYRALPKDFAIEDRVRDIKGFYVPYFLFDMYGYAESTCKCTTVKTRTSGNTTTTTTRHYRVKRRIDGDIVKLPADASVKLDDEMMDQLEPFNYSKLAPFDVRYLAGFSSEKYSESDVQLTPRVKDKATLYLKDYLSTTMSRYNTVHYLDLYTDLRNTEINYALLPVWIITYNYKGEDLIFAMNGQTGAIGGTPPISWSRLLTRGSTFGLIAALIVTAIQLL